MRRFFTVLILLLAFSAPARADFEAGQKAYTDKDWVEAISQLRPLVESGDARAMMLLGNMYNDGDGVIVNPVEAMKLYKNAAALGSTKAMVAIAAMYQRGAGGPPDINRAVAWFQRAASLGDQAGAFFYGMMLFHGDPDGKSGFKRDELGAYKWMKIAASMDSYDKMKPAAEETAKIMAGRLSATELEKMNEAAAAFKPADPKTLGPLPD